MQEKLLNAKKRIVVKMLLALFNVRLTLKNWTKVKSDMTNRFRRYRVPTDVLYMSLIKIKKRYGHIYLCFLPHPPLPPKGNDPRVSSMMK
jgi:hypothetical protein